jgi:hypothetical protein
VCVPKYNLFGLLFVSECEFDVTSKSVMKQTAVPSLCLQS